VTQDQQRNSYVKAVCPGTLEHDRHYVKEHSVRSRMILSRKLLRILAVRVVRSIILRVANDVPQAIHGLKRPRKYHKIEMFPGSSMVEHSAVNFHTNR